MNRIHVWFLAIAAEGRAKNISGGKFVHKYHLPSPSSVISAIKGLVLYRRIYRSAVPDLYDMEYSEDNDLR